MSEFVVQTSPATDRSASHKRLILAGFFVLIALGAVIRIANLSGVAARSPDERTYTLEADSVALHGTEGIRSVVSQFQKDTTLFAYPAPTRVGYLWTLAGMMSLTSMTDERAGADLSCIASILSMLLVGLIGWRFFKPSAALMALLFFAVSPFELLLARRAWQDAVVECLALAILFVTFEIVRNVKRSNGWLIALAMLGGITFTMKELSVLSFAACAAFVLWTFIEQKEWKLLLAFVCYGVITVGVSLWWLSYSVGSFQTLVEFTRATTRALNNSGYSIEYESGPPTRLFEALWTISPVVLVFALYSMIASVWRGSARLHFPKEGRRITVLLSLFVLAFWALTVVSAHRLNLRYISVTFGALYLLGGLGLYSLISLVREKIVAMDSSQDRSSAFAVAAVVVMLIPAFLDYGSYRTYANRGILDLSAKMLLDPATTPRAFNPPPPPPPPIDVKKVEADVASKPTAENYMNLSQVYYSAKRFPDCIDAARNALHIKPNYPEAWNNICAAYNELGRFEEGKSAGEEALRLAPNYPLAKANLNWSIQELKKR